MQNTTTFSIYLINITLLNTTHFNWLHKSVDNTTIAIKSLHNAQADSNSRLNSALIAISFSSICWDASLNTRHRMRSVSDQMSAPHAYNEILLVWAGFYIFLKILFSQAASQRVFPMDRKHKPTAIDSTVETMTLSGWGLCWSRKKRKSRKEFIGSSKQYRRLVR